ncbi:MAG: serine hydrolase [Gemmatimonadaceae bacterium]|nr:serine hydrolase [Gemmatimonadaceae bacterium]
MTSRYYNMVGLRVGALALAAAIASGGASAQAPDLASFDKYVARAAHDWRVPGLAIAIVKDNSLVFAKGYGVLELGKTAPATEHTRFAIGSTTKAMTVASLAMLVDEGMLKWDDRITDYFPDLQLYDAYATRELTIRDLLTHRTGLPGTDLLWAYPENQYSPAEMMRRLRYVKPISSFRSQWEYQNVMYGIAGALVAERSGMPWETFVRTRIFAPLGMTESIPLVSGIAGKPNVARPHDIVRDTVRLVKLRTTDAIAPAGSVWSSVADMSKWMRFMLDSGRVGDRRLIKAATFNEIVAPQMRAPMSQYPALSLSKPNFFSYALGWFVSDFHGETVWMHTGSIDGMSAIIGLLPERHVGVYVLANLDHAELRHALMYQVFDMYRSAPSAHRRDWSADVKSLFDSLHASAHAAVAAAASKAKTGGAEQSLPLDRYTGSYVDSTYGPIQVTLAGGALRARFVNFDIGELKHGSYESFSSVKEDELEGITELTFVPDGAGHVAAVQAFGETFKRSESGEK